MHPVTIALFVVALALCVAGPTRASDNEEQAIALYTEGEQHYTGGRYQEALAAFQSAYALEPVAGLLVNIGQCHRQLGDHAAAAGAFEQYLKEDPAAENRAEVEELLAAERALLPKPAARPPAPPRPRQPDDDGLLASPILWVAVGATALVAAGGVALLVATAPPAPLPLAGSLGNFDLR